MTFVFCFSLPERPPTSIFLRFFASSIVTVNLPAVGTYRREKQMSPNLFSYMYITQDVYQKKKVSNLNKHTASRSPGGGDISLISRITFPKSTAFNGICTSPI